MMMVMVVVVKVMVMVMMVPSRWNHNDPRRAVPSMVMVMMMIIIKLGQFNLAISRR